MNCPIDPPACHPQDEVTTDDVNNFLAWRGSVSKGAYKKTWKPRKDEADANASYLRATRK